jgi:hypothetical protein
MAKSAPLACTGRVLHARYSVNVEDIKCVSVCVCVCEYVRLRVSMCVSECVCV